MSNTRYIELSSSYRNRTDWPNPAQFEVPIAQSGQKTKTTALDPVSLATPKQSWCSNTFDAGTSSATITLTVVSVGSSSPSAFIVTAATGKMQPADDYYVGAIAVNTTLSQYQRIAGYKFLGDYGGGLDHAEIVTEFSYGAAFAIANSITVTDPTRFTSTTNPDIFVPSGRVSNNSYPKCILYNETKSEHRPILDYDFYTHLLEINTTASAGGAVTGWAVTDCFSIRREPPALAGITPGPNTTTTVVLPALSRPRIRSLNSFSFCLVFLIIFKRPISI